MVKLMSYEKHELPYTHSNKNTIHAMKCIRKYIHTSGKMGTINHCFKRLKYYFEKKCSALRYNFYDLFQEKLIFMRRACQ